MIATRMPESSAGSAASGRSLPGPSGCAHAKFGIVTLDLRDLQLRLIPRRGLNLGAVMRAGRLFGAGCNRLRVVRCLPKIGRARGILSGVARASFALRHGGLGRPAIACCCRDRRETGVYPNGSALISGTQTASSCQIKYGDRSLSTHPAATAPGNVASARQCRLPIHQARSGLHRAGAPRLSARRA